MKELSEVRCAGIASKWIHPANTSRHLQCGPAPDPGCVGWQRPCPRGGFMHLQEIKAVSERGGEHTRISVCGRATEQAERGGEVEGDVGQAGWSEPGTMS